MTERIATALVGCGKVGHTHALALSQLPQSRFVAVCSRTPEHAAAFGRLYGTRPYVSLDEMLERERPGMVAICTPHPTHAELVETCAAAGAHVLVEKPLAPDLAGCDRAIEACARAGVRLGVISQRRLYRPVVRMAQAIDEGRIGRPVLRDPHGARVARRGLLPLRPVARTVGHRGRRRAGQPDAPPARPASQWIMGPIEELYGYWDNLNHPYVEVEDTAVAVIRFRSGALGSVVLSNSQKPGLYGRLHVHGSTGASVGVQTEGGSAFVSGVTTDVEPPVNDLWTIPGEEHLLPPWQEEDRAVGSQSIDVMTHYHRLQIEDFLDAILHDREPMVDGHEGRKVVEMITAVYRCAARRSPGHVSRSLPRATGPTTTAGSASACSAAVARSTNDEGAPAQRTRPARIHRRP